MAIKEFTIKTEMEERWIPHFQSFLKYMQSMGNLGHSCSVAFYCDGDGDFRPKFDFDIPFEKVDGIAHKELIELHKDDCYKIETAPCLVPEVLFDAG